MTRRNMNSSAEPRRGGGGNNDDEGVVLLRNGRVVDPAGGMDGTADVLVRDGRIDSVARGIAVEQGSRVVELEGKLVVPGLIDMHVHLREPGREDEETIQSGGRAAAAGGFTAVACMANTQPVIDNAGMVRFVLEVAEKQSPVRVFCVAAATVGLKGEAMTEIMDMRDAGAVAVSDDGKFIQNSEVARRVMEYCRMAGIPFISHCEDQYLSAGGVMHEGYWSTVLGLKGIPAAAETAAVARELSLAELTGARVHIAHVSTGDAVELVRQAKKRGLSVSAETAPHYLVLTDKAVCGYDTSAKVNPPLRSEEDRERVMEGLKDGTIDSIASDHAPHCEEEKDVEFGAAAFGLVGLETTVGLVMTFLVRKGVVPLRDAVSAMTVKPATALGIDGGTLAVGRRADITIIDPELEWEVDPCRFASGSRNTPFKGMKLTGKAVATMVAGKFVYEA
jgi:dihydroorotase